MTTSQQIEQVLMMNGFRVISIPKGLNRKKYDEWLSDHSCFATYVRELRLYVPGHNKPFRFDWGNPYKKIAIEFEGGAYSGGGHVRGKKYTLDCLKYNEAQLQGWKVFRFTCRSGFTSIIERI